MLLANVHTHARTHARTRIRMHARVLLLTRCNVQHHSHAYSMVIVLTPTSSNSKMVQVVLFLILHAALHSKNKIIRALVLHHPPRHGMHRLQSSLVIFLQLRNTTQYNATHHDATQYNTIPTTPSIAIQRNKKRFPSSSGESSLSSRQNIYYRTITTSSRVSSRNLTNTHGRTNERTISGKHLYMYPKGYEKFTSCPPTPFLFVMSSAAHSCVEKREPPCIIS